MSSKPAMIKAQTLGRNFLHACYMGHASQKTVEYSGEEVKNAGKDAEIDIA
jgi:hypothetical protein